VTSPLQEALDEVVRTVEQARRAPMSASVLVHRGELLEQLERLRALLPQELGRAQAVLGDREALVEQGRAEAARIVEQAQHERAQLVAETEVHRQAVEDATRLLEDATERVASMRGEVDEYVDGKLATFEIALHRTLAAVERGRAKLAGRSDLDELAGDLER
jgi:chromosome segregation ATPase